MESRPVLSQKLDSIIVLVIGCQGSEVVTLYYSDINSINGKKAVLSF